MEISNLVKIILTFDIFFGMLIILILPITSIFFYIRFERFFDLSFSLFLGTALICFFLAVMALPLPSGI